MIKNFSFLRIETFSRVSVTLSMSVAILVKVISAGITLTKSATDSQRAERFPRKVTDPGDHIPSTPFLTLTSMVLDHSRINLQRKVYKNGVGLKLQLKSSRTREITNKERKTFWNTNDNTFTAHCFIQVKAKRISLYLCSKACSLLCW